MASFIMCAMSLNRSAQAFSISVLHCSPIAGWTAQINWGPINWNQEKKYMKQHCCDLIFNFELQYEHFKLHNYTSTKSWRGCIFTAICLCVCLCVCLSVCLSGSACEQNSSRTDEPIWTRFSLNGCIPQWLKLCWHWSKVKVKVT